MTSGSDDRRQTAGDVTQAVTGLKASVGFASDQGPRAANEDFAASIFGAELPKPRWDIIAALADGIGGAKGGRVASEIAVRGFLDGFLDLPETLEVARAGALIVNALNGWIHSQGRQDPNLAGMGCTFTALVLRGRTAHILHVGDSRAYRLTGDRLTCLTTDHLRASPRGKPLLYRALGIEPEVRLDYAAQPVALHDRFLLCSDGLHGFLSNEAIADILRERSAPGDTAKALVTAALDSGGGDNCTALVLDIVGLPSAKSAELGTTIMRLPLVPVPRGGETIDNYVLQVLMSDGRYSRLFGAADEIEGGEVVLKFPKPEVGRSEHYHAAFVREAWVGTRVNSPFVGRVLELPPGRQTCLYTVMPLYQGELLERRLARRPALGLEEGRNITVKLARAAAALHRIGVIHRDIKPDNVMLEAEGSLKLLDLGVVRIAGTEEEDDEPVPGTLAYVAPEMLDGERGNAATDIYALGVTMFRAYTGEYPYGNLDAVSLSRLTRPKELCLLRPDLPAWLQAALSRAIALDPAERYQDMIEFALEMEAGPSRMPSATPRPRSFYERAPVQFWQAVSALLGFGLILSLWLRH